MAADTGMDTCPSPEITDSRKRPLDGDSENGDVKRSHFSSVQDLVTALPLANGHGNITSHFAVEPTYHFKVLVPSMVAGAIIGKGGETIAQLQKDTGARVKMSKSHDFYPGTTERACLITGSVDGIMVVLDFIMDKIKEKPELVKPFPEGVDTKMPQDRDKQVKILVPNSTAGMIIGKGGNYIKQIKEQSGSYVQISQKAKELSLQERCITVVGEKENNKKACLMILQKVVDDPQSGSCPNVSYADVAGPVANYNPTGSPYAVPTAEGMDMLQNHGLGGGVGGVLVNGAVGAVGGGLGSLSLSLSLAPPGSQPPAPISQHTLDHIKVALRQAGYSEAGISEIGAALALLVKHGVLGLALPAALPAPQLSAAYFPLPAQDPPPVFGPIGQVPLARNVLMRRARRLLRAFRGGCIRGASPPSRGAHLAVGRRGRRGRLPVRLAAAAVQEPHARRRGRQGLQERGDRRGHRRGHTRPRRAQPGGDPADVWRQHPDLQEGHVRAGHAQPHRHHHGHAHGHLQRAVPHRAEDPGGGAEAHAPQRHLRADAVTRPEPGTQAAVPPPFRCSVVSSSSQTLLDHRPRCWRARVLTPLGRDLPDSS